MTNAQHPNDATNDSTNPAHDATTSPLRDKNSPQIHDHHGVLRREEMAFMEDVRASLLTQSTPGSMAVLYLMLAVLTIALVWASMARVEEITQGQGKVIPASREQIIQSLEGGILEEMRVHEGDIVQRGQVLLKIDPTRAGASYAESLAKVMGIKGSITRARAEAYRLPLIFPADVLTMPDIVREQSEVFEARKRSLQEGAAVMQTSLDLAEKEIALAEPLAKRGLLSEVELLRMRRQANEMRLQLVERHNKFRAEASADLTRLEQELSQLQHSVVALKDTMQRTTILAPVRGTVKNVRVTTIGGVIKQGEDIMEIVPLEDQLLVEAKIRPSDVAFLRPGQNATVKISAYDYAIYGGLKGRIEHISPDTLREERPTPGLQQSDTYYRVFVRTDMAALKAAGKELPILPGMTTTVEIRTGEKSVISYLLKPIFKAREAFRER
ncbi:HlyD family type I secretion periplasmic adaptor subunit [Herbaspirillum sp. RTI4]|uniref:HlyD family type I secretion periplasmic adaptor subunit n=1 Tax=Herbaspirillum sp. RTI4 TaxID=3048640 RepID=UPI002AB5250E|nr:HlyD family type I secretion periplasmic adaptor subunit [Herbaspirillum sp. RTI4]MDY7577982.1 HlyD family type I secretion periplasmic adaptor subunit [Herbaspirillum sp. RTI4]MEA9982088.1 HlyD family type I secretion periplasmic adaptor subunit [Herbaspirillum sp. RTI4]